MFYRARGLCCWCHTQCEKDDSIHDYPLRYRRREDVIQDYLEIRARTRTKELTMKEVAEIMGMKPKTLDQVLCRARKAGIRIEPDIETEKK